MEYIPYPVPSYLGDISVPLTPSSRECALRRLFRARQGWHTLVFFNLGCQPVGSPSTHVHRAATQTPGSINRRHSFGYKNSCPLLASIDRLDWISPFSYLSPKMARMICMPNSVTRPQCFETGRTPCHPSIHHHRPPLASWRSADSQCGSCLPPTTRGVPPGAGRS